MELVSCIHGSEALIWCLSAAEKQIRKHKNGWSEDARNNYGHSRPDARTRSMKICVLLNLKGMLIETSAIIHSVSVLDDYRTFRMWNLERLSRLIYCTELGINSKSFSNVLTVALRSIIPAVIYCETERASCLTNLDFKI